MPKVVKVSQKLGKYAKSWGKFANCYFCCSRELEILFLKKWVGGI